MWLSGKTGCLSARFPILSSQQRVELRHGRVITQGLSCSECSAVPQDFLSIAFEIIVPGITQAVIVIHFQGKASGSFGFGGRFLGGL